MITFRCMHHKCRRYSLDEEEMSFYFSIYSFLLVKRTQEG